MFSLHLCFSDDYNNQIEIKNTSNLDFLLEPLIMSASCHREGAWAGGAYDEPHTTREREGGGAGRDSMKKARTREREREKESESEKDKERERGRKRERERNGREREGASKRVSARASERGDRES